MATWWREGPEFNSSQAVRISGLSRNYKFSETQMGRGGTHGSGSIRGYMTKNERFSQDVRVECGYDRSG